MYRTDGSFRRVTNRASRCRHALAWHCDCPQATMVFPWHECHRILCRTPGRNRSTATCQYPIRPAGCSTTFVRSCCSSIRSLRLRATLVRWSSYMCIPAAAGTTTSDSSWATESCTSVSGRRGCAMAMERFKSDRSDKNHHRRLPALEWFTSVLPNNK